MQILLVPDVDMPAFLETGIVSGAWREIRDDTKIYLRPVDFERYLCGAAPELRGRIGRVFVWWRDDYDFGECDLDETLVPVNEWTDGGWLHQVDALVVEVRGGGGGGDVEMEP